MHNFVVDWTVPRVRVQTPLAVKEGPGVCIAYTVLSLAFASPSNKQLKVIAIGAGVFGILPAYKIQRHIENVDLVTFD